MRSRTDRDRPQHQHRARPHRSRPRRSVGLEERPGRPETARSCLPFVWLRLCVTRRFGQRPAPAMEKHRGHRRHGRDAAGGTAVAPLPALCPGSIRQPATTMLPVPGGPNVRIHLPPAASPVRTRVFGANPIDGQRMISPWSNPIANFDLRWTTYDIVNFGQCRRGDCSMSSVRDWTTGFAVIGTILLGPMIAFLTVVAAEVLIDFLKERAVIAAIAVCAVVAGMVGWVLLWLLFRRMSPYRVFLWVFFRRLTNTSD